MDYDAIIRSAWDICRKNRFFWVLGILGGASAAAPGNVIGSFAAGIANIIGQGRSASAAMSDPGQTARVVVVGLLGLLAVLLVGLFFYCMMAFRAALIDGVAQSVEGKILGFRSAFGRGRLWVWKLLGLSLYLWLWMALGALAMGVVILGAWFFLGWAVGVVLAGALAVVALVLLAFISLLNEVAARALILDGKGIRASVTAAITVMRAKKSEIAVLWAISLGLGTAMGLGILCVLLLPAILLGGIGWLIASFAGTIAVLVYAVPVGLAFTLSAALLFGFGGAFVSAFWTLGYRELERTHGK